MIAGIPTALLECEAYLSGLSHEKEHMRFLRLEVLADRYPAAVMTDGHSMLLVRWNDPHATPGTGTPGEAVDVPLAVLRALRGAIKRHDGHCGYPKEWHAEAMVGGGVAGLKTGNGPRSLAITWETDALLSEPKPYPDWRSVAGAWGGKKPPTVEDAASVMETTSFPGAPKRPKWTDPFLGIAPHATAVLCDLVLRLGMDGTAGIDVAGPDRPMSLRCWTGCAPVRMYAYGLLMPATIDSEHWVRAWEGPGLHMPSLAVRQTPPADIPVEAPGVPVEASGS